MCHDETSQIIQCYACISYYHVHRLPFESPLQPDQPNGHVWPHKVLYNCSIRLVYEQPFHFPAELDVIYSRVHALMDTMLPNYTSLEDTVILL